MVDNLTSSGACASPEALCAEQPLKLYCIFVGCHSGTTLMKWTWTLQWLIDETEILRDTARRCHTLILERPGLAIPLTTYSIHVNKTENGPDFKHNLRHGVTMVSHSPVHRDLLRSTVYVITDADIHRTEARLSRPLASPNREQFRTKQTSPTS